MQATLNSDGEVVQRTVLEGAYGEDEFELNAPAVDRIAITATTTSTGAIESVEVSIRATEPLAAATVASGAHLTVVDANGTVIRSTTATPSLIENDDATLRWTLTAAEWTTLTAGPGSLSVTITNTLRATTWPATTEILPPPPATTLHPLTTVTTWLATIPPPPPAPPPSTPPPPSPP